MSDLATSATIVVPIGSEQEEEARNALQTLVADIGGGPSEVWRENAPGQNITFTVRVKGRTVDEVSARLAELSGLTFDVEDDSDTSTD
ncbi:hypothetical protein GCM10010492_64450 [Saccharothrix mutabilis subsp. mutabilis]|uniref:Uncharacterized protein n=1 Tax=Saccharothrix mutabilis subsp. mutabilis TaxID=66855 RepID=A0ABP3EAC7_9PSEU